MSEFLAPDGGTSLYQTTEHYLQRVLAGDVGNVRTRLLAALDRVGYDLIDDDEFVLRARRGAHGWASSYCSADVLDYPRTLIIRLKATSAHATRATFDYVIKHPSLSRGEVEVLTREAEAITAMATVRAADNFCAACGTTTTDDSRFCRQCGAPISGEETALEVLRMTAEVRAGHTSVVATAVTTLISAALMIAALVMLLARGPALGMGISLLFIFGVTLSLLSVLFVSFGWNRLNRALKGTGKELKMATGRIAPPLQTLPPAGALAAPPLPRSVTEGTTELLRRQSEELEAPRLEK